MNKLSCFLILITLLCISLKSSAQPPNKFSYQAVCRNSAGNIIAGQAVSLRLTIHDQLPAGTVLYKETHSVTTNNLGLVTLAVGGGVVNTGSFSSIPWGSGSKYLEVELNTGSGFSSLGTTQLLSVPYALYAENANVPGIPGPTGPQGPPGSVINLGGFIHYPGELYGGGVVFHVYRDSTGVEHGLVLALTDQSTSSRWSNLFILAGPSAQSKWDGLTNSNTIVAQPGHIASAAILCLDLVSEGYSDWYLPSIQELNLVWNNYYAVSKTLSTTPGATEMASDFTNWYAKYWSSTELTLEQAVHFDFNFGVPYNYNCSFTKSNQLYVRAIRAY